MFRVMKKWKWNQYSSVDVVDGMNLSEEEDEKEQSIHELLRHVQMEGRNEWTYWQNSQFVSQRPEAVSELMKRKIFLFRLRLLEDLHVQCEISKKCNCIIPADIIRHLVFVLFDIKTHHMSHFSCISYTLSLYWFVTSSQCNKMFSVCLIAIQWSTFIYFFLI